jgi:hypothetical protein
MSETNKLHVAVTRRGKSIRIRASKSGRPLTEEDLTQLQILEYELANTPGGEPHSEVPEE